jgi:CheY-like chemotaxis protein
MATAVGLTKDKHLELTLDVPETLPLLRIDKTRVRQVLLNLLSNAAKFTESGGITLRAYTDQRPTTNDQRAAATNNGDAGLKGDDQSFVVRRSSFVVIEVRDTGVGIAPEHQALIFEEFRQIDGALNRQQQGTGLGLPISKRLVEMHGGRMWLESSAGIGSTFSFTLPIDRPAPLPGIATIEPQITDSPDVISVVVVDDDPDAQAILRQYLSSVGYRVHAVLDSRQALSTIQQIRPQLVLLDVEMPHLDGWEILAQLRTMPETAMLPVIICSVVDQQQLGIALGVCAHMVKPVHEATLLALVQRYATPAATVLVVDDDPDARQVIRGILDGVSCRVIEACDGAAGLAAVQRDNPDLIILDLMLPELDGFELLAQLRAQPAHADRPVIVVSAKDLTSDERRWLCARAQHTIHKHQLSATEFLASVQRLIGKEPSHAN